MYWYVGVRIDAQVWMFGAFASSKKYSVSARGRPSAPRNDRPSIGYAGSGVIPAAARAVGLMSMFATKRLSCVPAARWPGQRAKNGTWTDGLYGTNFVSIIRC